MGLDISAYKQIERCTEPDAIDEHGDVNDGFVKFYINPTFPKQAEGIESGVPYRYADADHFYCASYGGYNRWRDQLAELAGYPSEIDEYNMPNHCLKLWRDEITKGPFVELIHFSDCEGTIGTEVAKKLVEDFETFQEKARTHPDPYFFTAYLKIRKAFEFASEDGAVRFH